MPRLRDQRGLSIVELMVGMAVSLIVVAIALLALTRHLDENRRMLTEARLMQDLRTAADLVGRNLRRAGPVAATANGVRYTPPGDSDELAYRLQDGTLEMKIGAGHWQAMTDAGTLRVSSFTVTPHTQEIVLDGFCSQPCATADASCPPRLNLRHVTLAITGRATHDASVSRTLNTTLALRHDALVGACPA